MINTVIFNMDLLQHGKIQQFANVRNFVIIDIDKLKIMLQCVIFQER